MMSCDFSSFFSSTLLPAFRFRPLALALSACGAYPIFILLCPSSSPRCGAGIYHHIDTSPSLPPWRICTAASLTPLLSSPDPTTCPAFLYALAPSPFTHCHQSSSSDETVFYAYLFPMTSVCQHARRTFGYVSDSNTSGRIIIFPRLLGSSFRNIAYLIIGTF